MDARTSFTSDSQPHKSCKNRHLDQDKQFINVSADSALLAVKLMIPQSRFDTNAGKNDDKSFWQSIDNALPAVKVRQ